MSQEKRILVYIGTYNLTTGYIPQANGKGIYLYSLNPATGELTYLSETGGIDNPGYLAIDPLHHNLYATNEVDAWPEGAVNAFKIDPATGGLTFINKQSSQGGVVCYLSVEKTGSNVLAANYETGKQAIVFPIKPDGSLAPASCTLVHYGAAMVDPARQEAPHAHCIVPEPSNRFVYIVDLGLNKIMIYKLDALRGVLTPNDVPSVDLHPGAGPRHVVFHPTGKYAYVINELDGTVCAMVCDPATGALQIMQTVSTLPEGYAGNGERNYPSHLEVEPAGQYLFGSNRGHDSIVSYAIDQNTGKLTYVCHESTKGKTPRNFGIDPTGTFLLAANQNSSNVVSFAINRENGRLEDTGFEAHVPNPACIKMIQI